MLSKNNTELCTSKVIVKYYFNMNMIHVTRLTGVSLFFVFKVGLSFFCHNHSNRFVTARCNVDSAALQMPNTFLMSSQVLTLNPKGSACPIIETVLTWFWLHLPIWGQDLSNTWKFSQRSTYFCKIGQNPQLSPGSHGWWYNLCFHILLFFTCVYT
jgi:hypothetical protein